MKVNRFFPLFLIPSLMFAAVGQAQEQDLAALDLETLLSMDVTVTSASRRAQAASDAAAAVYVITREDIRRSGATTLPDVLRLAPGVQVARISSRSWAVSARGFNMRFASKLLVMVDGRSIYTPQFSGVIWEEQSPFLHEIERIEIVRGPGGALWGINAVNGVVNIITRNAAASRGLQVHAGAGTFENKSAAMSYGGRNDLLGDYRLFVDHSELDAFEENVGELTHTHLGMRLDRGFAGGALMLQGNFEESDFGNAPAPPAASLATTARAGNVAATWQRATTPGELELSTHYSWTERGSPSKWDESAFGFSTQFNAERVGRHVLTAGAGFLYFADELNEATPELVLHDRKVAQHQWSFYVQDEMHFFADRARFILGAKLEELEFTGLAFQPTLRTVWDVTDAHTLWAAASRAVRTPSRIELHSQLTFGGYTPDGLILLRAYGNEHLDAEDLNAYELGWRWRASQTLTFDAALYRNDYKKLIGGVPRTPIFELEPVPALVLESDFANIDDLRVSGIELVAEWHASEWLSFEAQGAWQDSEAQAGIQPGPIDPERMLALRARIDLPRDVELDLTWRSVSELTGYGIPAYDIVDLRAGWQPAKAINFSLAVENVFDDEHIEHIGDLTFAPAVTIGRMVIGRISWKPGF